ncbi:ABC transporter permease [Halobacteriaceae archaeon SHR40]|uniref:ABC transporter permease n=1 Tax=Halovenus amylolytica TaxID=2500550 RepID=UPI000FE42399
MSIQNTQTGTEETTTIQQKVLENKRPAAIWAVGMLVLVGLEFGRITGWVVTAGGVAALIFDLFVSLPAIIGSNVGGVFGFAGDFVATGVRLVTTVAVALLLLAIPAGTVRRLLPVSPAKELRPEMPVNIRLLVDRAIVTLGLFVAALLIVLTPVGGAVDSIIAAIQSLFDSAASVQTLTSRETIPNQGYESPSGSGWEGTFMGLSPALAWALRVTVIYLYATLLVFWIWKGYTTYRQHYREADWTPLDDSIDRFRGHKWGLFGLAVVFAFLVLAIWAPVMGPTTIEANHYEPYSNEFQYLGDSGDVQSTFHGTANIQSRSNGDSNVGPMSYDDYGRWAPFGTNADGKDLFTFLAFGARTSLVIGLVTIGLSGMFALILALVSSYYKGIIDLVAVMGSDTVQSIPALLLILMLMVTLREFEHPIVGIYDGGILLAFILAFTYWPGLWRSIRGPTLQVSESEWIDAAKSYGQKPSVIMRKHMAPYVLAYMLIYASLILGTIIITTAALSFLGIGIGAPTPEWGRMIESGRGYISTQSWHISTIPGIMIVFVVIGFNALGDAIRDAIDIEADISGESATGGAA